MTWKSESDVMMVFADMSAMVGGEGARGAKSVRGDLVWTVETSEALGYIARFTKASAAPCRERAKGESKRHRA